MTAGPDDVAASVARLRARVVTRIRDLGGDDALAAGIADFVARAAHGRLRDLDADPGVWDRLEELGVSLAARRLRAQRKRVSDELADVATGGKGEGGAEVDVVLAALEAVPLRERMLLELVYLESYDLEDAAEFFNLSEASVKRLLARARRRLRREYERARSRLDGAGFVVETARRARGVVGRTTAEWVETVVQWAQLNPLSTAIAGTAAAVSIAAVVAVGAGPTVIPRTDSPSLAAHAPGVKLAVPKAVVDHPQHSDVRGHERPAARAASEQPRPLVVGRVVHTTPAGTQTRYQVETTKPTAGPSDEPSPRRDEDRLVDAFVFVDCPRPEDRAAHEAVVCLLVAPP